MAYDAYCFYFGLLGVATTAYVAVKVLLQIVNDFRLYLWPRIGPSVDLTSYGEWAIITGGSDGIGKGYAMELAKRGLNICVISNVENGIVSAIRQVYNVDCVWVSADFSSPDVYSKIEKELSFLDSVGILINNVGMVQQEMQTVLAQSGEFHKKILNVNVLSMVMMTEMVLKRMVKRNKGLIVNMGSISSVIVLPYATMYSSTKSFVETYSCCLAAELSDTNVEVKCLQPWFVRTQLIKGFVKTNEFLGRYFPWTVPNPQTFTASAAATFGRPTPVLFNGYWTHSIIQFFTPYSLLGKARMAAVVKWFQQRITGDFL